MCGAGLKPAHTTDRGFLGARQGFAPFWDALLRIGRRMRRPYGVCRGGFETRATDTSAVDRALSTSLGCVTSANNNPVAAPPTPNPTAHSFAERPHAQSSVLCSVLFGPDAEHRHPARVSQR